MRFSRITWFSSSVISGFSYNNLSWVSTNGKNPPDSAVLSRAPPFHHHSEAPAMHQVSCYGWEQPSQYGCYHMTLILPKRCKKCKKQGNRSFGTVHAVASLKSSLCTAPKMFGSCAVRAESALLRTMPCSASGAAFRAAAAAAAGGVSGGRWRPAALVAQRMGSHAGRRPFCFAPLGEGGRGAPLVRAGADRRAARWVSAGGFSFQERLDAAPQAVRRRCPGRKDTGAFSWR